MHFKLSKYDMYYKYQTFLKNKKNEQVCYVLICFLIDIIYKKQKVVDK